MHIIYCLVPKAYWEQWAERDVYLPRDYEEEGFIHATKEEELLGRVADRVYADFTGDLLVLVVDEERVTSPVTYEQAKDGRLYPHIYGPLNQDAIVEVRRMEKREGHWGIGASCPSR